MGLALFKERRLNERRKLTGLLPGRLMMVDTKKDVTCRPVDVSVNGLGIVVGGHKQDIEPGTEMVLLVKEKPVRLQVAWGQPDFGKQDFFRYGLVTLDPNDNLEELFIRTGCMR